jgi:hypothetical protein
MFAELLRLLRGTFGLLTDSTEAAVRAYLKLLRLVAIPTLSLSALGLVLVIAGESWGSSTGAAVGMWLLGLVLVLSLLLGFPFIWAGTAILRFESATKTLRLIGLVAGWSFLLGLVAFTTPPGASAATRAFLVLLALLVGALLFGSRPSRTLLGAKLGVILIGLALAVFMPRTFVMVDAAWRWLDREIAEVIDPPVRELELTLQNLQSTPLFASDGSPLFWCRNAPERDAGYRCYGRPGSDPYINEELRPITGDLVRDAVKRLTETARPRAVEDVPARGEQQGQERGTVVRDDNKRASSNSSSADSRSAVPPVDRDLQRRYLVASALDRPASAVRPRWTIVAWSQVGPVPFIEERISGVGRQAGLPPTTTVFADAFITSGAAERIIGGDLALLSQLNLSEFIDYVVLARGTESALPPDKYDEIRSVRTGLEVRVLRLGREAGSRALRTQDLGAGRDEQAAVERSYEKSLERIVPALSVELKEIAK